MMLARSVGRPRASLEERTLSWDEVQQALRSAFFSGEEPDLSLIHISEPTRP